MLIVGLTGGIGSGKTTVANMLIKKGYAVYNSDIRAKELMVENSELKKEIIKLLGNQAYDGEILNRKYIAQKIFSDKDLLQKQNALVHTAVKNDFKQWAEQQESPIIFKEAAILFESGAYKSCNYNVVVSAPIDIRIKRVQARDNSTEEEIQKRIQNQWSQEKIIELSDFQIENNLGLENLEQQVNNLINHLKSVHT